MRPVAAVERGDMRLTRPINRLRFGCFHAHEGSLRKMVHVILPNLPASLRPGCTYSAQGACNSSPSGRKVRVPIGITAIASSGSPSAGPKSW
jgi:hypothetical protein